MTLRCECGKQLGQGGSRAIANEPLDFDFVLMVPGDRVKYAPPSYDSWWRIDCPRCGRTWEGRGSAIDRAAQIAFAAGARSVTLP
jgi:hypothetical protein